MTSERLITPKEAAEELSVSESTLLRWCRTGKLKCVKVGKQWRISAGQLRALKAGGRFTIRQPGCTAWTSVDTLQEAQKELIYANRNIMSGHIIYDNWKEKTIDNSKVE